MGTNGDIVRDFMMAHPDESFTTKDICEKTGLKVTVVNRVLAKMRVYGLVTVTDRKVVQLLKQKKEMKFYRWVG